jgi:hypothetical protein
MTGDGDALFCFHQRNLCIEQIDRRSELHVALSESGPSTLTGMGGHKQSVPIARLGQFWDTPYFRWPVCHGRSMELFMELWLDFPANRPDFSSRGLWRALARYRPGSQRSSITRAIRSASACRAINRTVPAGGQACMDAEAEPLAPFAGASSDSHQEAHDCFGHFLVRVTCRCGSVRVSTPEALARLVGWSLSLEALAQRMRCSQCGGEGG